MPDGPFAEDGAGSEAVLADLLARIGRRDEAALRVLYDRTAPKLLGVVLRIQSDRGMAEDVLQDVFLRIWQKAASYSPAAGRPLAWLCTIARNRAIDGVRRRSEVQGPATEDGEDWVERLADPHDSEGTILGRNALQACLGRLEALHRDCIVLAYCEGQSREDLALRYDRPVSTIKTWLHRGLATLRGCLDGAP
ncbi:MULTISPECIES: sigma-70 family RNA polymerase sigma factor [Methylobacterium]|uniref:sigma-70 family RNA polymerase sigma factor n=1 Tax=Methylobacterium TaxID=407 RepID=UPI0009E67015|nr:MULTISPECIES: sigma-70 family RNA polymerase sigma factor [Methylobacterium]MCI9881497.1 sigma-70 family RNA polymerase sigma factor [Methylobacterium goesingense]